MPWYGPKPADIYDNKLYSIRIPYCIDCQVRYHVYMHYYRCFAVDTYISRDLKIWQLLIIQYKQEELNRAGVVLKIS